MISFLRIQNTISSRFMDVFPIISFIVCGLIVGMAARPGAAGLTGACAVFSTLYILLSKSYVGLDCTV